MTIHLMDSSSEEETLLAITEHVGNLQNDDTVGASIPLAAWIYQ